MHFKCLVTLQTSYLQGAYGCQTTGSGDYWENLIFAYLRRSISLILGLGDVSPLPNTPHKFLREECISDKLEPLSISFTPPRLEGQTTNIMLLVKENNSDSGCIGRVLLSCQNSGLVRTDRCIHRVEYLENFARFRYFPFQC